MTTRILTRAELEFRARALSGLSELQRDIVHSLMSAADDTDHAIAERHRTTEDEVRKERSRALAILRALKQTA
jgi:hypothetical protein